jgi:hypothetical protein
MAKTDLLADDIHKEVQHLLPWYLTGRLDELSRARVEAHLANCAECRADLVGERRLMVEWAVLPIEAEHSWQRLRERLSVGPQSDIGGRTRLSGRLAAAGMKARRAVNSALPILGWALAAVQAIALVLIGVSPPPASAGGEYHSLGSAGPSTAGNILVMFRPDTAEQSVREILNSYHVRVVDGPTPAGAWLLHAPAPDRGRTLIGLRRFSAIEMAQPVDSDVTR